MKYLKFIVPLAIVVLMLMIALPAAADDPFGGPPSRTSGNGTSTWAAIYIANRCSAKVTAAAGSGTWFKFDTWKSVDTEIYVDDVPKWGAAYNYFNGQWPPAGNTGIGKTFDDTQGNTDSQDNSERLGPYTNQGGRIANIGGDGWGHFPGGYQTKEQAQYDQWGDVGKEVDNGFVARLFDPSNMNNMDYFFPTPNNSLLTTRNATRVRIGDTQGGTSGYSRGSRSQVNISVYGEPGNYSYLRHYDIKMADGETHLLSGRQHYDGWAYMRVYNLMVWDNDMMACTRYIPRNDYNFVGTPFGTTNVATGSK